MEKARLDLGSQVVELPYVIGTMGEKAIDISRLRSDTGFITFDDGFGNTGSCQSAILLSCRW
jgi:citrate synthase